MKVFSAVLTLFLAATAVLALPQQGGFLSDVLPRDYTLSNITWTGAVFEGGSNETFTGTSLQDIEAQIQAVNPSFDWANKNSTDESYKTANEGYYGEVRCNIPGYKAAVSTHILEGIDYLSRLTGDCTAGPADGSGKGNCGRVSCSWNSAIFYCNDNLEPHTEPCNAFATYAHDVLFTCWQRIHYTSTWTQGQQFGPSNFNVVVGKDYC
ncbi:hypothetical protein F5B20DRAFT_585116 [Whalleya microplaca]|nr:hypothetical protein F5B20DRAFT_585116 [Whalleya microplaca]